MIRVFMLRTPLMLVQSYFSLLALSYACSLPYDLFLQLLIFYLVSVDWLASNCYALPRVA